MCVVVRKVNEWFRHATRADVDNLLSKIILSERQSVIFDMFYLKKQNIGFIADDLCISATVINMELKAIRNKINRII